MQHGTGGRGRCLSSGMEFVGVRDYRERLGSSRDGHVEVLGIEVFGRDQNRMLEFEAFDQQRSSHSLVGESSSCLARALASGGECVVDRVMASFSECDEGAPDFVVQLRSCHSHAIHSCECGERLRDWSESGGVVNGFEGGNLFLVGGAPRAYRPLYCARESLL